MQGSEDSALTLADAMDTQLDICCIFGAVSAGEVSLSTYTLNRKYPKNI